MKKTTTFSAWTLAAALMLTACSNGKPFEELASVTEEAGNEMIKVMKELENASGLKEAQERMNEAMKPYEEKGKKIRKSLDGTEIETVATEETGLTLEKGFTISAKEDGEDTSIKLEAKVKIGEDAQPSDVSAIGYDGDTPVLFFAGRQYYSNSPLNIDKEEGTLSFNLNAAPSDVKQLAAVDKIVLTADRALADSMARERSEREKAMWKSIFEGESSAAQTKESATPTLNKALFGNWYVEANSTSVSIELKENLGTYEGQKGYGTLSAYVEFEPAFTLVFTSLTPDGDNIKVHYYQMVTDFTGDIDDPDSEGEWVTEKRGEGDLTLIPQGKKMKIDSKDPTIKGKVLSKV